MKQRALTQLIQTAGDLDYVEHFQALAKVNLEIRNQGPTRERLLRRSILEMDVGNYAAGLHAAKEAIVLDARSAEAHYQAGVAHVLMAFVRAGALPLGPGMTELPRDSVEVHLRRALDAFDEALELNPEDEEALAERAVLADFLEEHEGEAPLTVALRGAVA